MAMANPRLRDVRSGSGGVHPRVARAGGTAEHPRRVRQPHGLPGGQGIRTQPEERRETFFGIRARAGRQVIQMVKARWVSIAYIALMVTILFLLEVVHTFGLLGL